MEAGQPVPTLEETLEMQRALVMKSRASTIEQAAAKRKQNTEGPPSGSL